MRENVICWLCGGLPEVVAMADGYWRKLCSECGSAGPFVTSERVIGPLAAESRKHGET